MANLVVLDSQTHRQVRVAARPTAEHAEVNVVSVIPREFPRLIAHYPIFFSKSSTTGRFEPTALLGFERGENLYWVNGQWDVDYMPLQIQRQPFSLLPRQDTSAGGQAVLEVAVDLGSTRIQTQDGERLFEEDGRPTRFLGTITSMLKALVSGATEAYEFTGRLAQLDLIEPVQIDVEFVDASDTKLQGLYWIAEAALKKLPAAQLAELRDREFLQWLYFQMASVSHLSGLISRKNRLLSGLTGLRGKPGAA